MAAILCFSCGKELAFSETNIGRSEECPHCRADVRVCFNCRHYDSSAYNECRESMAERVTDKDRRNFCDYFFLGGAQGRASAKNAKDEAKQKLDALFKN